MKPTKLQKTINAARTLAKDVERVGIYEALEDWEEGELAYFLNVLADAAETSEVERDDLS